jgi:hypothetical protein
VKTKPKEQGSEEEGREMQGNAEFEDKFGVETDGSGNAESC